MLVAVLGLIEPGCDESQIPATASAHAGFVAFIGAAEDDPLWPTLRATAERYREGLDGMDLVTRAPALRSPNAQIDLIRELHTPQMRGLCIVPADQAIMRDVLCELRTKGVAVVTMLEPIECDDPLPFSGIDEMGIGKAMANALLDALGGTGTIAVLTNAKASRAVKDRAIGFDDRMEEFSSITVLRELDCGGTPFVAERMIRDYLERYPRLDAWVALDNWPLRERNDSAKLLPATCRLVTSDPFPRYWPYLSDGTCAALVGAEYERVTESALRMCVVAARGEPLNITAYYAPPVTVTVKNLSWYRMNWFKAVERPREARTAEANGDVGSTGKP